MIDIISPVTNEKIGQVTEMTTTEVDSVIEASHSAFQSWKSETIYTRSQLVKKAADLMKENLTELTKLISSEVGKSEEDAKSEIIRSCEYALHMAEVAKTLKGEIFYGDAFSGRQKGQKTAYLNREPLGVVVAISPFNYPISLAISKIVPALLAGNTVVFKPSTQGALSGQYLVDLFHKAGINKKVLHLVTGKAEVIGDHLVTRPKVALIAFTGSTATGMRISEATKGLKPLLMELGGKDSAIVLSDANLELASAEIVRGAFEYSGQRCTAIKRVFVESGVSEEFTKQVVERAKSLTLGPLISESQKRYVLDLLGDASVYGARVALNGSVSGNSIQPTILTNINEKMKIFHEEQFGPLLPIITVQSVDQAVAWINHSNYALQTSIFSNDLDKAMKIAEIIDVGTVQINARTGRSPDNFPFLGIRGSGVGPAQGTIESIRSMTKEKVIVINRQ